MSPLTHRYGTVDPDYGLRLATWDPAADHGVYMLNLMKYRAEADYGAGGERGVSGRDADDRYAPLDVLAAIGATVCFVADVVDGSEDWDRVAVARYPTRRSFIEMQSRPDFQARHVHKDAGMDRTIVMGTVPVGGLPGTTSGPVLLEVWRGATPPPSATRAPTPFAVEGTILGDGRSWTGARYTLSPGTVDLALATPDHQLLLLQPTLEEWK